VLVAVANRNKWFKTKNFVREKGHVLHCHYIENAETKCTTFTALLNGMFRMVEYLAGAYPV
jgi:hypothetical protein